MPNGRQAIIWTNADSIHWCTYAAQIGGRRVLTVTPVTQIVINVSKTELHLWRVLMMYVVGFTMVRLVEVTLHERHAFSNYHKLHWLFNSLIRMTKVETSKLHTQRSSVDSPRKGSVMRKGLPYHGVKVYTHSLPLSSLPVTGGLPSHGATKAESVSMSWRHHCIPHGAHLSLLLSQCTLHRASHRLMTSHLKYWEISRDHVGHFKWCLISVSVFEILDITRKH